MAKAVKCSRCGRENDPSFAFCLDCGLPLKPQAAAPPPAGTCAACGSTLQPGFRFCGHCGAPVAAGPSTPPPPSRPAGAPPAPVPAAGPAPWRIVAVRHDGLNGAVHGLEREETVCGRLEGEVRLPEDPTVSPRHARFTRGHDAVRVEDLGSVNGTFVRLTAPRRLQVGEEVRLGRQLLRLEPLPRPASTEERGVRPWGAPDAGAHLRLAQLLEGGGLGEIFPLRPGENSVGREAGDITFPGDRYVSARHARLDVTPDGVLLTDLGSSNGTFVKLAGPAELASGDQLLIGAQLFRLER